MQRRKQQNWHAMPERLAYWIVTRCFPRTAERIYDDAFRVGFEEGCHTFGHDVEEMGDGKVIFRRHEGLIRMLKAAGHA